MNDGGTTAYGRHGAPARRAGAAWLAVPLLLATASAPGVDITLPGENWSLALDLADYTLARDQYRGSDNRTILFLHRDGRARISIALSPAIGRLGPLDYRAARWKRLRAADPVEEGESFWERDGAAFLEYRVGAEKNLLAFLQTGRTRIEVHLAIARFGAVDQPLVERVVGTLAIAERGRRRFDAARGTR